MATLTLSPNLALNQRVAKRTAAGESIVHMGFGEARLPAFAPLVQVLVANAHRNAYGPVAGTAAAREAAAGYFTRRRLPTTADQMVLAPGSKPLLMAVHLAVRGSVLLPRPCWNSYRPQAELAGNKVLEVPIPDSCGGVPEPSALSRTIHAARSRGQNPRILVLTLPDNPTGTLAPPSLIRELCLIAEDEDLLIISDEIYRDLVHDPSTPFLSPAEVVPQRTLVTTGLSKSLAIGGWRIGVARFPNSPLGERIHAGVLSVASDVWSTVASPMHEVAAYAFAEPAEVREHLSACARLHGSLARAVHRIATDAGASCRPPTAGFYVYPDFEPIRDSLARWGVSDSSSLQQHLLDEFGIAVLAGHHLGDHERALRFKAATSMLYGDTREQQYQSLHAEDPLQLHHIRQVLTRIKESFAKLSR
jgi:aspartate aminotransferase